MEEYENKNSIVDLQEYNIGRVQENIELLLYSSICFIVPFLLGGPQIVVGAIVNTILVLSALNLRMKMIIPAIVLPSMAVLLNGLLFGPYSIFLVIMMPFIWIGNLILVLLYKKLLLQKKYNPVGVILISSIGKASILFLSALLLYGLGLIPIIILGSMGIMQLYTAMLGGIIGLGVHNAKKRLHAMNQ